MPPAHLIKQSSDPPPPPEFHLKPTRHPMLWAALSYSSGIVAGAYAWRPAPWWVVAGAAFLAAGLYFVRRRRWLGVALALGAFFLAGALHNQLRGAAALLHNTLPPLSGGA